MAAVGLFLAQLTSLTQWSQWKEWMRWTGRLSPRGYGASVFARLRRDKQRECSFLYSARRIWGPKGVCVPPAQSKFENPVPVFHTFFCNHVGNISLIP